MNTRIARRIRSRAFTLVEVVTSLTISSILLVAIGSAMVLAGRAMPASDGPGAATLNAATALDTMASELRFALHFPERTARSIRFTIPDRDGDGSAEVIRYAWSGVAGSAITRQYNSSSAVVFLDNVHYAAFDYQTTTVVEAYPGEPVEGDETLLASHMPAAGTYSQKEFKLDKDKWPGQFVKPSLPINAQSWRVTRVRYKAASGAGNVENYGVELYKANAGRLPTGGELGQVTVLEPSNSAFQKFEAVFNNATALGPTDNLCLVFPNLSRSGVSGKLEFADNSGGGGLLSASYNLLLGSSYSIDTTDTLLYEVVGKIATPSVRTLNRTVLTSIGLTFQTHSDAASRVATAVALPNQPEVLSAQWQTNFNENPITIDRNLDGQTDWRSTTGFDTSRLVAGVWKADRAIDSNPVNSFTDFTTLEVGLRDSTATGAGAGVEMRVEASLLGHGIIEAYITLQSDGTQTLTLQTRDLLLLPKVLLNVPNLSSDFVRLKLYVNPANDSVGVVANDVFHGSYNYNRSIDLSDGVIRLFSPWGEAGAEFDYATVRVGGQP